jgi:hypothetical protein
MSLGDLTPGQRRVLDALLASPLADSFYLTGGTALSSFHLHHRASEDLDLFSRSPFDAKAVVALVNEIAEGEPKPRRVQDHLGFSLRTSGEWVKVEFVHYDFEPLEPPVPRYGRLRVDGRRDILANKLSALVERTEPKDFADVLVLLREPDLTLASAIADCRRKFGWPGLEYLLQTAFLKIDRLPAWPVLNPPLSLEEARPAFHEFVRSLIRLDAG